MATAKPVTPPAAEPVPQSWLAGREWLLFLVPVLAVAASLSLGYLWNEDFWWYLTSGQYLLKNLHFPSADPFLYTAGKGLAWVTHSWLWTVLIALVHRLAGLDGVVVFHALVALALCVLIYTTARVDRFGLVNALALTLFLATFGERACGKAEMASWLLLAIFYQLLDSEKPFTWKRGAVLGGLQVLWANLHGGYPLGIFVALCFSVGGWIEMRFGKTAEKGEARPSRFPPLWFPALLLLLAVADPWMFKERLEPFAFVSGSRSVQPVGESGKLLIVEWESPFKAAANDPSLPWLYGFAVVAGLASFVAARRWPLPRVLFLLGMAVLGATAVRHLPGLALSAALVILANLHGRPPRKPASQPKRLRKAQAPRKARTVIPWPYLTACALVALTLLGAAVGLQIARPGFEGGQSSGFFTMRPAIACPQAASFILDHNLPGPIFNDFQMGAYLTFRLFPKYRLFIDSRVLEPTVVERYTAMKSTPSRWQEEDDRYGFRTVVLGSFSTMVRSPLGQTLLRDPRWHLVYLDPLAVIFVKDSTEPPAVQVGLPAPAGRSQSPKPPYVAPASFVAPLPRLQRVFLHDFPSNYLVEYLGNLGQLGRAGDVIDLATQALKSMPEQALLYQRRCEGQLAMRNFPAALDDCTSAYKRGSGDPLAAARYSVFLNSIGKKEEAAAVLQKALQDWPDDETLNRVRMGLR
ncbi:MAG TPA: hypothetical protein VGS07_11775 [Thermoanaerobaculia bacterium]|jgi:hypothetical protein|nr:hypothetical protein [Thermoanaerobaculia bacterium]